MKENLSVFAIDDGPFRFEDDQCLITGVATRGASYIESVLSEYVCVDGNDATDVCIDLVKRCHQSIQIILVDGASLAGFNVIDLRRLNEQTGIPVVSVTYESPDMENIQSALKKNFSDWQSRWELIRTGTLSSITTEKGTVFIRVFGISISEAKYILNILSLRGVVPEPLRISHLIASGFIKR